MWCKHCREDTPRVSSASRHGMCCGRCGVPLSSDAARQAEAADESSHPAEIGLDLDAPSSAAPNFEDWRLDHDVRAMRARLQPWHIRPAASRSADAGSRQRQWRLDAAEARVPRPHQPQRPLTAPRAVRRAPTFTNSALMMGLTAGVGGVAVIGWSMAEARSDLWNIGLSAVVAGAVVFLLGLVLQLERIWHNGRFAVRKLRQIDSHLQDLERTTASLGVTHGAASQAFYSHMADQAHPHLLLSDLKGQIDLLATNFGRR